MLEPTRHDPLGYNVIAEPGRYFSSGSCHLLTRVIGRRTKNSMPCYHINDSLYHSFNAKIMDGLSLDTPDQFQNATALQPCKIFGMTCDGMDVIADNVMMPVLSVGDWLCISHMGAYTIGPKSTFNGMHVASEVEVMPAVDARLSQTQQ
jgi:diaminopimelate decarboxylase